MTDQSGCSGSKIKQCGLGIMRYGLIIILLWIGGMKFTAYEASGIEPLVSNSLLMAWVYNFLSVQALSNVLGVSEIIVALLMLSRPLSPKLSLLGGLGGVMMFLTTISFLFTTPGWEASLGGFPALSVVPGQFILKDVVLLGVSLWMVGDSLTAISLKHKPTLA